VIEIREFAIAKILKAYPKLAKTPAPSEFAFSEIKKSVSFLIKIVLKKNGNEILKKSFSAFSKGEKIFLKSNFKLICVSICKNAPIKVPKIIPFTPKNFDKTATPKIVPKLYKSGANAKRIYLFSEIKVAEKKLLKERKIPTGIKLLLHKTKRSFLLSEILLSRINFAKLSVEKKKIAETKKTKNERKIKTLPANLRADFKFSSLSRIKIGKNANIIMLSEEIA